MSNNSIYLTTVLLFSALQFSVLQSAEASRPVYHSLTHMIADAGGIAVVTVATVEKLEVPLDRPREHDTWYPTHRVEVVRQELFRGVVAKKFKIRIEISAEHNLNTHLKVGSRAIVFLRSDQCKKLELAESDRLVPLDGDFFLAVNDIVADNNEAFGLKALEFIRSVTAPEKAEVAPGVGIFRKVGDIYTQACREGLQSPHPEVRWWILGRAMNGVEIDDRSAPLILSALNDPSPNARIVAAGLLMVAQYEPGTIPLAIHAKKLTETNRHKDVIHRYLIGRNIVWRLQAMPEERVGPIIKYLVTHHKDDTVSLRISNHAGILKAIPSGLGYPRLPGATIRSINEWLAPVRVPACKFTIRFGVRDGQLVIQAE